MDINRPDILAEVNAACDDYESALMSNDLDALDQLFQDSPDTVRYGVGENLYGIDEIRAFRTGRPGGSPQRKVVKRVVTTYGDAMGISNLEFQREGSSTLGRQSQTWLKTPSGWRIVSAHVSLMGKTH